MSKTFIISDTHFGHNKIYSFTDDRGNRIRPWATNAKEGDEYMVQAWNSVVGKNDRVYHLGDVAIPRSGLRILERLNGRKVLIRGNHDIFRLKDYIPYFDDVRGTWKLDRFLLSHYPIRDLPKWCLANVHGHTHINLVTRRRWFRRVSDKRYLNVCVEHWRRPIDFDVIKKLYTEKE